MEPRSQQAIAMVGLGYVGLPLALNLGKHFRDAGALRTAGIAAWRL